MNGISYIELLKDPRWQRMRLEVMQRDDFTCQACLDTKRTLNVHHHFYKKGASPWEYESSDLVTLCEDCHKVTTDKRSELLLAIRPLLAGELDRVVAYALAVQAAESDGPGAVIPCPSNSAWMGAKDACRAGGGYDVKGGVYVKSSSEAYADHLASLEEEK